jgi:XTP/dITP diphosphohydrolase
MMRILIASSNLGKLREYQAMSAAATSAAPTSGEALQFALLPDFASLPAFDESAPTFAENAAGKALHYSRFASDAVIADDSGLVVPALGGAPGVNSARYAGPNASDAERVHKLLADLREKRVTDRTARFVCVLALARQGDVLAVFSDFVEGVLLDAPRGSGGFGYDPVFLYPPLGKTFAEIAREEKNLLSHRGKAFRKLLAYSLTDAGLLA